MTSFDQFWAIYPRHVGRLAAEREFAKALRLATPEQILAGVERYKRTKPAYADWCHPKTFLSQGRWMDEPDVVQPQPGRQAAQFDQGGPSARDLELIAQWEREHGKGAL